jgi:hypothetical protein
MTDLTKVEAGSYEVVGRKGWTVTRASKYSGEVEIWQLPGWWYLEGPGGVFVESETMKEIQSEIRQRIRNYEGSIFLERVEA